MWPLYVLAGIALLAYAAYAFASVVRHVSLWSTIPASIIVGTIVLVFGFHEYFKTFWGPADVLAAFWGFILGDLLQPGQSIDWKGPKLLMVLLLLVGGYGLYVLANAQLLAPASLFGGMGGLVLGVFKEQVVRVGVGRDADSQPTAPAEEGE